MIDVVTDAEERLIHDVRYAAHISPRLQWSRTPPALHTTPILPRASDSPLSDTPERGLVTPERLMHITPIPKASSGHCDPALQITPISRLSGSPLGDTPPERTDTSPELREPREQREPREPTPTDSQDPSRARKGRTIYKAQQVFVLEQVFGRTHYPDPEVIETLAKDLEISENKIKVSKKTCIINIKKTNKLRLTPVNK